MKRKQLFMGSVYVDALKQLRLMGLIYLTCCLVFTILPSWLSLLGQSDTYIPEFIDIAPVLLIYMFVAPITLTYAAFSYLTKRNASDFYHSLPVSRECAFFSRTAAVATYLVGTVVLTLLSAYFVYMCFGNPVNINYLPFQLLSYSAGSLLVMACALIGLSATGTFFSAFIVTGLALFLPRCIMVVMSTIITESAQIIPSTNMTNGLLSSNIPVSIFLRIFTGRELGDLLMSHSSIIYTLVLSAVYCVAGGVLHHFRKSETAQKNAPNRVLQHIYRCCISLPLFLVVSMLLTVRWQEGGFTLLFYVDELLLSLCVAAALVVYFVYELITTRKLRNLLSALYVLPILVLVSFSITTGGYLIGQHEQKRLPTAQQVQSVCLDVDPSYNRMNYSTIQLTKVNYTDEELESILLKGLSNTINTVQQHLSTTGHTRMLVRFNLSGGRSITRYVYLANEPYMRVHEIKQEDPAFRNAISKLPEDHEIMVLGDSSLTDAQRTLLWNTFRQEYESLTYDEQRQVNYIASSQVIEDTSYASTEAPVATQEYNSNYNACILEFSGVTKLNNFYGQYSLNQFTPKSLLMYMQMTNELHVPSMQEELAKALEWTQNIDVDQIVESYMDASFHVYDPAGKERTSYGFSSSYYKRDEDPDMLEHSRQKELLDFLGQCSTDVQSIDDGYVLTLYYMSYYTDGYGIGLNDVHFKITAQQLEQFKQLMVSQNQE